ncbi:methyltransferase domain-containing protein [Phycicoccus flavus]|uniref:Methyltransferase domain-containing protein n=1 Tax=Phycicoccus flavus TaxID=2502783 RepID=A0A8T6R7K4_9MICO|nr:methyltransferase domain-containing protein [Phycicoccus flavus]NHA68211.1 methyltransferase domain-containing protein [Phycicoccus flavus]
MRADAVEITDLLWDVAADGVRRPVRRSAVVDRLRATGQHGAARIVARMPATDDVLDPDAVDALGVRVHCELTRLVEELQFPRRVAATLAPVLDRLRAAGPGPVRVVDLGCGLGYVVRSLARSGLLGPDVELVGVDLNPVLVAEAERLRRDEDLACRFVHGDALAPGVAVERPGRTVVVSSGVLHHLSTEELTALVRAQAGLGVAGWAHWDIAPCLWSTLGAWVFHRARMREPVSRHDGVLSARRAHPAPVLLAAARDGAPGYRHAVLEGPRWHPRAIDVVRPLVGTRP